VAKIYLADLYHSGIARPGSSSIHLRITEAVRYPYILESFAYANERMARLIRRNDQRMFLDSGAFTMHTQNTIVSMVRYAKFIARNSDIIDGAANLDVIGPGHEQQSYDRLKRLQQLLEFDGLPHLLKPVHHVLDRDYWLERYLDEGYDYILLGGMVPETTRTRRWWLDHLWRHYLTNPDGTAKVRVHGFGLGSRSLIFRYPFYSVDTSDWVSIRYGGGVLMDFPRNDGSVKDYKILFSDGSNDNPWHYRNLDAADRKVVDLRLEAIETTRTKDPEVEAAFKAELGCKMGFNPEALSKSYGLRHLANIGYFHRAMQRGINRFEDRRIYASDR
jgi:hypothetical protein